MSFSPFTVLKSLLIKKEGTLTPDSIEIVPNGTDSTKTTIVSSQTADITLNLPDVTDTLVGSVAAQSLTNKTIDADQNTITNIDNADIKVGAAIDAAKIHDGTVSNTEFGYLDGVTSSIQTQLTNNATAISDHIADAVGAHAASAISNIPSGNLLATDVQSALNEIQTELDAVVIVGNNAAIRTLNNLTTTAINADLLPDTDGTRDLGSSTLEFAETHSKSLNRTTSGNLSVNVADGALVLNPSTVIDANGKVISNVASPVAAGDAVNKEYADSLSAGLDPKAAVRVASTTDIGGSYATTPSNGRLTGAATSIDGVTLTSGDRVLLKDQTDAKQNGIYIYDGAGQYTRSPDMDGSPAAEVSAGNYTFATQGTLNSASGFVLIGNGLVTLNTDNVVFTAFSGGSGGASRFLDNLLSPVAINQDLLPGSNNTRDLGSSSLKFKDAYLQGQLRVNGNITTDAATNLSISANGILTLQSGTSGAATLKSQDSSAGSTSQVNVVSGNVSAGAGSTGDVVVKSGNSASSNSGNTVIDAGTGNLPATQGKVQLSGRYVEVIKPLNLTQGQTAIPVASQQSITIPSSGVSEGLIQTTSSDSSIRNILTAAPTGLPQAPNLIIGGDAEGKLVGSTSIFTPYADAAGTSPVDGIGGSPNVTSAITATSPLSGSKSFTLTKDAANRQGQGWSILDVNVPLAMRGRVLSIKFDYIVNSGTFNAGTTTTDSDVTIWIYDIGNLRVIQPSSYKLLSNSTTVADQFQAEFQTPIDMQSFRLIAHIGSTNAAAYELELDNIVVSPSEYVFGTPISDWAPYTPVFTNFGAVTNAKGFHRRVGDKMELRFSVTTGTTVAALASMSLPPGYSIDSNKLNITNNTTAASGDFVGITTTSQSATNLRGSVLTAPGTSTTLLYFSQQDGASANKLIPANGNTVAAPTIIFTGEASIPIAGQSSSVQMADQTSTRVVTMRATKTGGSATANTTISTWSAKDKDTHNAFNSTTGEYIVPVPGDYNVDFMLAATTSGAGNGQILVNGTVFIAKAIDQSMGQYGASGLIPNLRTGDIITVRLDVTRTQTGTGSSNYLSIERISGPSQIASSETVAAKYRVLSSASAGTGSPSAPFNYATKVIDTHNAVTVGVAWRFTAPISGIYEVSATYVDPTTATFIAVHLDGTAFDLLATSNAASTPNSGSTLVPMNAGQFVDIRPSVSTALNSTSLTTFNCVNIQRIGNRG